jgi:hypothetical protein
VPASPGLHHLNILATLAFSDLQSRAKAVSVISGMGASAPPQDRCHAQGLG